MPNFETRVARLPIDIQRLIALWARRMKTQRLWKLVRNTIRTLEIAVYWTMDMYATPEDPGRTGRLEDGLIHLYQRVGDNINMPHVERVAEFNIRPRRARPSYKRFRPY